MSEQGDADETDLENELILDMICNLQMCKHLYNTFYSSAADNLREIFVNSPFYFIESVMED